MATRGFEGEAYLKDKANKGCLVEDEIDNDMEKEESGSGGAGAGFGDDEKKKRVASGKRGSGGCASPPRCQVEKCGADLTNAKRYHRRHKVCEFHAKSPVVTVAGLRQRFCQQCSRFHELSEFDEAKRSCRRRLAGHNERRRKSSADGCGEGSSRKVVSSQSRETDERERIQVAFPGNTSFKRSLIR